MKSLLAILVVLAVCGQSIDGLRILGIFPLNGKSHWVMMEQLMKGLAQRGHQVDVVTHFLQPKPIPNYTEISIQGSLEQVMNNVTAHDIRAFGASFSMDQFVYMAGTRICNLLNLPVFQNLIKNPPKDPPYDLVIMEIFVFPCFMAFGRQLKVPVIGTVTCNYPDWLTDYTGNSNNPAFVPGIFSAYGQRMTFWQRAINTFATTVISTQINYLTSFQIEDVKKHFDVDVSSLDELYEDLALMLVNSHHSLNGIRPHTHAVVEVGGLHLNDNGDPLSPEVQKWLDDSKDGCVFFTFGSMVRIETFPNETVLAMYKAFENIAPTRVLMKIAKKEELLPGLPKNVMTQPWFPQMAVLKHKNTKVFITHGGLMGTQEAIYAGVPMVGIPLFGDQHINIQSYVRKNVAVSLGSVENVTAESLTHALRTVLHDSTYRENVKKLSQLFTDRPHSALDTAIYWVEYVGRHGTILQSPAIHLTWWQRNLLDVYGFFALCIVTVLWIVVLLLRKAKNWLLGSKACAKKAGRDSKKNK